MSILNLLNVSVYISAKTEVDVFTTCLSFGPVCHSEILSSVQFTAFSSDQHKYKYTHTHSGIYTHTHACCGIKDLLSIDQNTIS